LHFLGKFRELNIDQLSRAHAMIIAAKGADSNESLKSPKYSTHGGSTLVDPVRIG
jgi:hypothetical protein